MKEDRYSYFKAQ